MTAAEQARWFIRHPAAMGRAVGFTLLRDDLHGPWIRWMDSGTRDGTLQAHRGSYKTTCLEVAIARLMIRHPDKNTIFIRKTDTDVAEVITSVDRILRHPVFRQIFKALTGADLQVLKSTSTEITTSAYGAPRGASQLLGIGIGGSLTGKHADFVITDDIVNLKDRISRAERDRTKAIYQELQNIRNPGGRIINTGTPWHKDDAFTLMPEPQVFDYRRTGLLTEAQIEELRHNMAPSLFAANYELKHIAAENALFSTPPEFFQDEGLLRDGKAHIDAAYGGEDYTSMTCAIKRGGIIYAYGRLWHTHVENVLPEAIAEAERLLCGPIYTETNADKGYLAKEIRQRGSRAFRYAEKENKHIKIATYLRKWWTKIKWLDGTDPEYLQQILDYSIDAAHDDAPDSAATICRILDGKQDVEENYKSPFGF